MCENVTSINMYVYYIKVPGSDGAAQMGCMWHADL